MEIRFSKVPADPIARVHEYAHAAGATARITKLRSPFLRFSLDGDERQHDEVIRALLTYDPHATIRTARAVYEGRDDFEAQVKARVSA